MTNRNITPKLTASVQAGILAHTVSQGAVSVLLSWAASELGTVECLDLALFIDRQQESMRPRIGIEPNDLVQLRISQTCIRAHAEPSQIRAVRSYPLGRVVN